jgi:hypothetical protein
MRVNELIGGFEIYTTNEELVVLEKLKEPVALSALSEHDQVVVANMIRKSLVTKIGHTDPMVVKNEKQT